MINHYLTFNFQLKQFIYFVLAFFCFTIIGTLTHEYGHIAVAKYLGYSTTLHFGSMNFNYEKDSEKLLKFYSLKNEKLKQNLSQIEINKYHKLVKKFNKNYLLINIGGPLETIVTGTIGFIFLLSRRKKIILLGMKFIDWLLIFISLFWLREIFNIGVHLLSVLFYDNENYFGGDEKNIADGLQLFSGAIAIPLAIIGLIISLIVIFKIIPINNRITFISGGFFGGIFGFIFWYKILGPVLLP